MLLDTSNTLAASASFAHSDALPSACVAKSANMIAFLSTRSRAWSSKSWSALAFKAFLHSPTNRTDDFQFIGHLHEEAQSSLCFKRTPRSSHICLSRPAVKPAALAFEGWIVEIADFMFWQSFRRKRCPSQLSNEFHRGPTVT
jgi:hypothetical protein